jgi:hypothetical protein
MRTNLSLVRFQSPRRNLIRMKQSARYELGLRQAADPRNVAVNQPVRSRGRRETHEKGRR